MRSLRLVERRDRPVAPPQAPQHPRRRRAPRCASVRWARRHGPQYARPFAHPSGATPEPLPAEFVPHHVAIVMDGNGRWANQRGLPRTKGHEAGEAALLDVVAGAIEVGVGT